MPKKQRKQLVALQNNKPSSDSKKRKKKKNTPAVVVIKTLLVLFLVVLVAFLCVVGQYLFAYFSPDDSDNITVPIDYTTTAKEQWSKVSYVLVGLMGEDTTKPLEMLSLVCIDKQGKTVDVLQLPVDTYLGKTDGWEVSTLNKAWSNPQDLTWCEKCRVRVYAPEVSAENCHTVCAEPLTTKRGSASQTLIDICNTQYSMPIDGFFILPQQALVKMVDSVGGVDVQLDSSITVDDVTYEKGVRTLSGAAALYYAVEADYKSTPDTDIERMQHQRQVFSALFVRMAAMSEDELHDKVLDPVMSGSTPIRVNETAQARNTLLAGISERTSEDADYERTMAVLIQAVGDFGLANMQYHILPGESVKNGSAKVYSVHKEALRTLLTEHFNPYGREITDADLHITELKNSDESDTKTAAWDTVTAAQEGVIAQEDADTQEDTDA